MLRLEPGAFRGHIALQVRRRTPLWRNASLLLALGIALTMHLAALGLFRIPDGWQVLPLGQPAPVGVFADTSWETESSAKAQLHADRRRPGQENPPRTQLPALAQIHPGHTHSKRLPGAPMHHLTFLTLHSFQPLSRQPLIQTRPSIQIQLMGGLADEPLQNPTKEWIQGLPKVESQYLFAVQVDQRAGQVIGITPLQGDSKIAESYVRKLRFRPRPHGTLIAGEIEIHAKVPP